ncbi:hypothetical protein [Embleya sp. NPDC005971]|uniref:hypothetical protein n=1 Tax=Embleya sp. NPDC005971 TaxID=3156724 RepID=UPI0033D5F0DE
MQRITRLTHAPGEVLGYVNGRPVYPIAGGSGEGEGQSDTDGQDQGDGDAGGDSDTETPESDAADWGDDSKKWAALAKKHEARARQNAAAAVKLQAVTAELDEVRRQGMSDHERALDEAKVAGRTEAALSFRSQIGRHAIAAAAAEAHVVVPTAALALMDLSALTDDRGEVDADKVAALVSEFAPVAQQPDERRHVTAGQGPRSTSKDRSTGSVAAGRDLYAERHNKT